MDSMLEQLTKINRNRTLNVESMSIIVIGRFNHHMYSQYYVCTNVVFSLDYNGRLLFHIILEWKLLIFHQSFGLFTELIHVAASEVFILLNAPIF